MNSSTNTGLRCLRRLVRLEGVTWRIGLWRWRCRDRSRADRSQPALRRGADRAAAGVQRAARCAIVLAGAERRFGQTPGEIEDARWERRLSAAAEFSEEGRSGDLGRCSGECVGADAVLGEPC